MTRPTPAELARYRRDMPTLKWVSRGIGEQLLAEIDWLLAEMDRRERAAFEAGCMHQVQCGMITDEEIAEYWFDYKAAQEAVPKPPTE